MLRVVKRLLDTGVSLQNIRVAVEHLRARGVEDLAGVTLFSDGTTVYECTSPEEIVDLLQGGQGVFGIAVGGTMREITGSLAEFPVERVEGDRVVPGRARRARPAPAGPHRGLSHSLASVATVNFAHESSTVVTVVVERDLHAM